MKKEKLRLVGIGNWDNENFIRIKADKKSSAIPRLLDSFLIELGFKSFSEKYRYGKNDNFRKKILYKYYILEHEFFENKEYKIHLIFEEKYIYIILKTSLENREKMMDKIMKYSKWIKILKRVKKKSFLVQR